VSEWVLKLFKSDPPICIWMFCGEYLWHYPIHINSIHVTKRYFVHVYDDSVWRICGTVTEDGDAAFVHWW